VEALIGAFYLDSGFRVAKNFVQRLFYKEIIEVEKNRHEKDYKSILQEFAQKRYRLVPQYRVVNTKGPDHDRRFFVDVTIKKKTYGPGSGASKKQAEQMAASIALRQLIRPKGLHDTGIEQTGREPHGKKGEKGIVRSGKRTKYSGKNARA
jgi:ribonuclease-3